MPFHLIHADITKLDTDAIVNAANSQLLAGSGVCGAIFRAAGSRAEGLQKECLAKAPCPAGQSVLTGSYGLPARYIIHTVGPIWQGGNQGEAALLASCYRSALSLAWEAHCRSIAFPLISSGIFGYPKRAALLVAREAITRFLEDYEEMEVYLALLDRSAVELGEKLEKGLEHYVHTYCQPESRGRRQTETVIQAFQVLSLEHAMASEASRSLEDDVNHLAESFSQQLFRLIDQKHYGDVEVYKRANMDRKLFSKIRSNRGYQPKKKTVLALAVALHLTVEETQKFLESAGYALSSSRETDVIVRYFLEKGQYDIYTINAALFRYGQPEL